MSLLARSSVPVLLALAQPLGPASAQDSATVVRLSREVAASPLRISGSFGRVETARGEIGARGVYCDSSRMVRLQAPSSTSVSLVPGTVLPWQEISRIEKRGHATGRGALIGLGLSTALALASIASNDCSNDVAGLCGVAAAANILAIPVGAGIGALIGSAVHRWKTVYRRP